MQYLTQEQKLKWDRDGYLHIPKFLSEPEKLSQWADEMLAWKQEQGTKWLLYKEKKPNGEKMVDRIERFIEYHRGFFDLINNEIILRILSDLFGEPPVLFKEKLFYKQPGGGGYKPHQDAPVWRIFGQNYHINVVIPIDDYSIDNGGLEIAPGEHRNGLLEMDKTRVLLKQITEEMEWIHVNLTKGDLLFFGSYLPHRSSRNQSNASRRSLYVTYNAVSQGDFRKKYFEHRAVRTPNLLELISKKFHK